MRRVAILLISSSLCAANAGAQTLDLGSMGGPDLGDRSVFTAQAAYHAQEARRLHAVSAGPDDAGDRVTLAGDEALAMRARGAMHALAARMLTGEGARDAAADHRMLVGRMIAHATQGLDDRAEAFLADARAAHAGEADTPTASRYTATRAALRAFVVRTDAVFGTVEDPRPMGFTVRSLDLALRPVLAELVPLLGDDERAALGEAWGADPPGVRASRSASGASSADSDVWAALERAERSPVHAAEAKRLAQLIRSAAEALGTLGTADPSLRREARDVFDASTSALLSDTRGVSAERRLVRLIAMGETLEAITRVRRGADGLAPGGLDALAQGIVRAALTPPDATGKDALVEALRVVRRGLDIAAARRTLTPPVRMTGHIRRAWLLMHAEQADREGAMLEMLLELVGKPARTTSPALVSSIQRTRRGYERLLALRMSDDWLDELREDGRLATLLGPGVTQRERDLLIFTLRDRIRDAAARDVRERALDDLSTLRERAERYGRRDIEDVLAGDEPAWLGETLGIRLAHELAEARAEWTRAWIDDDPDGRIHWAERLGMLIRARDLVVLARRMDDASLIERSARAPSVFWPDHARDPLRDRARGLASGAVRTALLDDPSTPDDDAAIRARLTTFEDHAAGAEALIALAEAAPDAQTDTQTDGFVRLLRGAAVLPPRDHPLREHRHDVASFVRWMHELHGVHGARGGERDREAILTHLDEVGADLRARLSSD